MSEDLSNNEFKATSFYGKVEVLNYPKNVLDLNFIKFDVENNTIYIGKSDNSSTVYLYGNVITANTATGWYGQLIDGLINQFASNTDNYLNQFSSTENNFLNQFTTN